MGVRPEMNNFRRRPVLYALGGLIILLGVLTAAWLFLTSRIEAGALQWRQDVLAKGGFAAFGAPERSGWPVAASVVLPGFTVGTGTPGGTGAAAWHAGRVVLSLAPWHPGSLEAAASGEQWLRVGPAAPVPMVTQSLSAAVSLGTSGAVSAELRDLRVPTPSGPLSVDGASVRAVGSTMTLTAAGIHLPDAGLPFGGLVDSIAGRASWNRPLPLQPDLAAALTAWRDAGGRLQIADLALRFGPLGIAGHGTLGLDRSLQPEAIGEARVTGWKETADALARAGTITANQARVATALLGLVAGPDSQSGTEATLPLQLKDRTLSVGAFPVMRMPVLALP
jgi:hypothetical protein